MMTRTFQCVLTAAAMITLATTSVLGMGSNLPWQEEFDLSNCNLVTTGQGSYFVLEPGFQLFLESDDTKLQITVLNETKNVDGINTRVVEEKEWVDGELYEISRNYFAMCEDSKDVFYFGEDVDFYEKGVVVKHDGSWLAGMNGNKAGLMMPGTPQEGMRYYQEIAPGEAMDRAEIISLDKKCETPAGTFSKCLKVKEGSAIELAAKEYKYHAPGIGLIRDEDLKLVKHGFIKE